MNRKTIGLIELTAGITILLLMYFTNGAFYLTALGGVLIGMGIKDYLS